MMLAAKPGISNTAFLLALSGAAQLLRYAKASQVDREEGTPKGDGFIFGPERRQRYARFVQDEAPPEEWELIREAVQRGQLTGNDRFNLSNVITRNLFQGNVLPEGEGTSRSVALGSPDAKKDWTSPSAEVRRIGGRAVRNIWP